MLNVSKAWKAAYPDACVGILAMQNVVNPKTCAALDALKVEIETQLRARFGEQGRAAIKALPTIRAYNAYYKAFKKTYHVQQQVESVALKGRSIPRVAALVEAMFAAELKNMLLTAGHDLDVVKPPIQLDIADGSEHYTRINGKAQQLKANDMMIADTEGVISSIIYGPDRRTQINPRTRNVLFTVYAPAGITSEAVLQHLADMQSNVRLIAPDAETAVLTVYGATEN